MTVNSCLDCVVYARADGHRPRKQACATLDGNYWSSKYQARRPILSGRSNCAKWDLVMGSCWGGSCTATPGNRCRFRGGSTTATPTPSCRQTLPVGGVTNLTFAECGNYTKGSNRHSLAPTGRLSARRRFRNRKSPSMNRSMSVWACLAALVFLLSCSSVLGEEGRDGKTAPGATGPDDQDALSPVGPRRDDLDRSHAGAEGVGQPP